jgi:4-hydroxythreonine-4-phosphate dehydrogenase
VDHGTALDLAGTGRAEPGSFLAAERLAAKLAALRHPAVSAPTGSATPAWTGT